jgi:aminoglycoside/choline kinase family phosphotransferase
MTDRDTDTRLHLLRNWLAERAHRLGLQPESLRPASDDASFRRYFRIDVNRAAGGSVIAMDAPPDREDCRPFVQAARVLKAAGLSVPEVIEADIDAGILLLEDLGNDTYLSCLTESSADQLYRDAGAALVKLQQASQPGVFPAYDRAMLEREMALYPDWYVARHKGVILSDSQRESLVQACSLLADAALAQPQVYVHRDWHSRNLMRIDAGRNPGVLDFQDAVQGPITYDLVSLLRDAYISWPEAQQIDWAIRYWEAARKAHLPVADDFGDFYRDFEWMGLQRQLKVLGIFARLQHRDGKSRYLADLPRVLEYALAAARRYQALSGLVRVLEEVENIAPAQSGLTF